MDKKHIFRQLLNKAISVALWTKAITCDKAGFRSRFCQVHQAGKIEIGVNRRNPRLINDLQLRILTYEKINLFLQNEPNFRKSQMNVNRVLTREYEKKTLGEHGKNEPKTNPKRTQTNPNEAKFKNAKMNPIQTQSKPDFSGYLRLLAISRIILSYFSAGRVSFNILRMSRIGVRCVVCVITMCWFCSFPISSANSLMCICLPASALTECSVS